MVFFVCETCNETLKKNQVEKHVHRCKCHAVTCVDCSVTFYGNDYDAHVTCISEAEKYEKSLFKGKKQKTNPQDAWISTLEEAVSSSAAPPAVKPHLSRLGELSNVPRNKKKFINFAKNSLKIYQDTVCESIWNYLESFKSTTSVAPAAPATEVDATAADISASKKRKNSEENLGDDSKKRKVSNDVGEDMDSKEKKDKKKKKSKSKEPEVVVQEVPVIEEAEISSKDKKKKKKDKKKDKHES